MPSPYPRHRRGALQWALNIFRLRPPLPGAQTRSRRASPPVAPSFGCRLQLDATGISLPTPFLLYGGNSAWFRSNQRRTYNSDPCASSSQSQTQLSSGTY
eukprot:scaffold41948_cov37-Tisochrysis_lutea.AAC.2